LNHDATAQPRGLAVKLNLFVFLGSNGSYREVSTPHGRNAGHACGLHEFEEKNHAKKTGNPFYHLAFHLWACSGALPASG